MGARNSLTDPIIGKPLGQKGASLGAQMVKNLPAMETQIRSLGQEDPLEKGKGTCSSILAWRSPWNCPFLETHVVLLTHEAPSQEGLQGESIQLHGGHCSEF